MNLCELYSLVDLEYRQSLTQLGREETLTREPPPSGVRYTSFTRPLIQAVQLSALGSHRPGFVSLQAHKRVSKYLSLSPSLPPTLPSSPSPFYSFPLPLSVSLTLSVVSSEGAPALLPLRTVFLPLLLVSHIGTLEIPQTQLYPNSSIKPDPHNLEISACPLTLSVSCMFISSHILCVL